MFAHLIACCFAALALGALSGIAAVDRSRAAAALVVGACLLPLATLAALLVAAL